MLHSNTLLNTGSPFTSPIQGSPHPPPPSKIGPRLGPLPQVHGAGPRGPPPYAPQQETLPIGALARNDSVTVLVNGRGWAIGFIIAVLEALNSYAGLRYTVKFLLPGEQSWQTGDFSAADIRPKNSWGR